VRRFVSLSLCIVSLLMVVSIPASAALRLTPNLTSIRFVEVSGGPNSVVFGANSAVLLTQLSNPMSGVNRDFFGLSDEHYDVFYSDANGVQDQDGDYLTIECQFGRTTGGGGCNIDEAYLMFEDGTERCACAVASAVYLGPNSVPGSAANAADCVTGNNSTMGSTATVNERLRITLSYDCATPTEVASWGRMKSIYR
jgi:hypothetical protein